MPWLRNTVVGFAVSVLIFVVSIVGRPMGSIATASDMQAGNIDYDSGFFFVRIRNLSVVTNLQWAGNGNNIDTAMYVEQSAPGDAG